MKEQGGIENVLKKYRVKYYKGLGTNTDKESIQYFANFDDNLISYKL